MDPFRRHGGALADAERSWPEAPRPWIDLSTGINPRPYPARPASRNARGRLPLGSELRRLEATAAQSFGVRDAERVAAVPGAEAALRLAPHLLGTEAVAVVGPTYGGHAEAWRAAGRRVQAVAPDSAATAPARTVVLVNPNNPDGCRWSPDALLHMADAMQDQDGWLVVDESFGDVAPTLSVAGADHPRIVVLRSFGKFFGLAGLRLGFVIAPGRLIERLRGMIGDWPISADAIAAGTQAYADGPWAERTRSRLAREARRLDALLHRADFEPRGGTDLFRLVAHPQAAERFERLGRAGILVRPFAEAPDQLRFGLPPVSAWRRLSKALGEMP